MRRELIESVVEEARGEEANLVIWDRRDTFTVEAEDLEKISLEDGYLRTVMKDSHAAVYVEYEQIYKLVVERERSKKSGVRTGFGASGE
jgi:hypothetical protein